MKCLFCGGEGISSSGRFIHESGIIHGLCEENRRLKEQLHNLLLKEKNIDLIQDKEERKC